MNDVAVLFGGPSPEHDVSVLTGLQAARALGPPVRAIYWSKEGLFFEVDPALEGAAFLGGPPGGAVGLRLVPEPDGGFVARSGRKERNIGLEVVINCCHGGPGEDGPLQAAMDLAHLKYTGPNLAGAVVGMDKLSFGALMTAASLPCLARLPLDGATSPVFAGPYIVKPRFGGSSIGIDVVADLETAKARLSANPHLARGAVLEPFRPDLFDVQLSLRSWPKLALSAVERPLRTESAGDILNYSDKYVGGEGMVSAPRELPARLPDKLASELRQTAIAVAEICGLRGLARLDFLSNGREELYVNEINTIPGSLAKYLWSPIAFTTLLSDMIEEARGVPTSSYTVEGADGTALRSAGAIANKLG